jgi:hypothetical protein
LSESTWFQASNEYVWNYQLDFAPTPFDKPTSRKIEHGTQSPEHTIYRVPPDNSA